MQNTDNAYRRRMKFMKKHYGIKEKRRLSTVCLAAGLLAACMTGTTASAAENLVDMQTAAEGETVKSYLTGEDVPASIGRRRPVAVMLGNSITAAPQSGLSSAGVVYEATVEGGMTRLMGIFEDYETPEKIGSVRSCRDYYLFYANEFDAIYAHFGQAVYALKYLDEGLINNLNGLSMEGTAFFRINERIAPHNAYTNAEYLEAGIDKLGYRQEYKPDYEGHYLFSEEEVVPDTEIPASVVRLDNYQDNHPWFEYDQNTKEYSRYQFGEAHVDAETGEQLTCDNIILQYSSWEPYDANGYLNVNALSGGNGKYITRGKAMDITWEKDEDWGITHYYGPDGEEIRLNTGKTWVEIVLNDTVGSISME